MGVFLMCKDIPVLYFDVDNGIYEFHNENLLPYQLKGRLHIIPEITDGLSRHDITQLAILMNKNTNAIEHYFAQRVLPLTRENAKKLYSLFGFEQLQDDHSKAYIALSCRSVSLQDNYWVRSDTGNEKWKDVNIRINSLNEVVTQVALYGKSLTLRGGDLHTPELNGQGLYAKAWKYNQDGLCLYKLGADKRDIESRIEVMVSKLLDKTNVQHVQYAGEIKDGRYACYCRCMTTEDKSILPAIDYYSYCTANNINYDESIMKIDEDSIYKMWIVDYLISNRDRHGMNWGFFYDSNTMQILGCHPLFDHNNAFDEELMKDKDAPYLFNQKMTMREAAQFAIKHTDFRFTDNIVKSDFMTTEQYESFMSRTEDLSLLMKKPSLLNVASGMNAKRIKL